MKTKCDRNTPFAGTVVGKLYHPADKAFDDPAPHVDTWMPEPEEPERSLRYNNGKADYSLLPQDSLEEAVRVLEYGASKYEIDNWLRPTNWRVSYGCLMRHMSAWQAGEDNDPESGRSHLGHALCNVLQMLHMLKHHPEELER